LALVAALVLNVGFFVQHGATNTMASLSIRHPLGSARALVTNRQWLAGYAAGWVGWGFYILALRFAPLSLVQAVAAGGVGVLAILAHFFGTPLVRRERIGAAVSVGGLLLLILSLTSHQPSTRPVDAVTLGLAIGAGGAVAGILALVVARRVRPAASLAAAAGLLFGVGDLATKGAVSGLGLYFVPVLAICTALAFVSLQLAFQRGPVLATAGLSTLINNLIPIVGGLAIFHDPVPSGLGGLLRIASFAAVVVGAVLLAHAPPVPEDEVTPPDPAGSLGGVRSI
jgi:hypothetical protein